MEEIILGNCRLILGDCLDAMKQMPDKSVDAVITDPTYGINYQSARRIDKRERFEILTNDDVVLRQWCIDAFGIAKEISCLFAFTRWDVEDIAREAIEDGEWIIKSQVVWDRGIHGLGDLEAQYAPCHDNAWFAIKNGYKFPGHRPKSVYRCDRLPANELLHPTQKPMPLMKMIIGDLTSSDNTIFDPFMGSGTTGVACVQLGRKFIGCEIHEPYFDIAVKRIKQAQLQMRLEI